MYRKIVLLTSLVLLVTLVGVNSAPAAAGKLLWQKNFNLLPDYDMIFPSLPVFSSPLCIVSGQAAKSDWSVGAVGFIKVYDMATGDLKWQRTLNLGASNNYFSDIVIDGNLVYMQSYSGSYYNTYDDETEITSRVYVLNRTVFGAYDANTGVPVWEETADNFSGSLAANPALPKIINRLVVVGCENPSGFGPSGDCLVKVYQAKDIDITAINTLLLNR